MWLIMKPQLLTPSSRRTRQNRNTRLKKGLAFIPPKSHPTEKLKLNPEKEEPWHWHWPFVGFPLLWTSPFVLSSMPPLTTTWSFNYFTYLCSALGLNAWKFSHWSNPLYFLCATFFFLQSSLPNEAVYDKEKNGVSVSSCIPGFINIRLDLCMCFCWWGLIIHAET